MRCPFCEYRERKFKLGDIEIDNERLFNEMKSIRNIYSWGDLSLSDSKLALFAQAIAETKGIIRVKEGK